MQQVVIPTEVEAVLRDFRTCEFSTIAKDGTPITWPTSAQWQAERGTFQLTTSIALPQKVYNIRRNPKVSLLFSNPTASGLDSPPAVQVQGDAVVTDRIITSAYELREYWLRSMSRQPASVMWSRNALMRYLMDWFYMRLVITVTPRRIRYWTEGNFHQLAEEIEVSHVG